MAVLIRFPVSDILVAMGDTCAILVVVDGLRGDALGSYGNEQADTPFLDRLSAESILFDFAFCLDPALDGFYASALFGVHPYARHAGADLMRQRAGLNSLAETGSHYLITDDPSVTELELHGFAWTDASTIRATDGDHWAAEGSTAFFKSAAEWLGERFRSSPDKPNVGWIHASLCRGGTPIGSRQEYDLRVARLDEGIRQVFSELSLPDETRRVLFVVTGARGYALGEHGEIGSGQALLHEELLHVPLIMHATEQGISPVRVLRLTSPVEWGGLFSGWLRGDPHAASAEATRSSIAVQLASPGDAKSANCLFFANSPGDQGIRTPGWYLIRKRRSDAEEGTAENGSARLQLFLKPDDRWESNEVSDRRPEIVKELVCRLDELARLASSGEPLRLPALPPELLKGS